MSCSSNSPITRRSFLGLCALWPLSGLANVAAAPPTAGLTQWGSGEFRRFGFLIYEATLWSGGDDPVRPPLALGLTYRRTIAGQDIAAASVREIRNLGGADEVTLKRWGEQMTGLFPDVRPGDRIVGQHLADGARFFHNDRWLGAIDDVAFARAFFAIWLDPRTSAPELRAALLRRPTT